ncbi:tetratricopeptide repeat protein [Pseudoxanthomonas sacheonensis]|uniref:protein O-GlcNAc transferase n=1 Tax=Pseudoxanthomonas sacheonensis TaxID=443615 RepID=A0ABU1RVY3_9GAMM|nr:tetratricopeptide repeat protein [Pseudoxanthomonas sacheonensis]MDR6842942.1 putative O-linked N-acetylglucosamine transferase (SPINDLY family) [Pseudoxanthomonas sacheonensis]
MAGTMFQETPSLLREQVRQNPGDFIAWVMLADAELDEGNLAAGQAAAERALALRPGHPEAQARIGRSLWASQRYGEAAVALHAASAAAPQHPGIALWLGHALEDAGDAEGAADAYARAHGLMPDNPALAAHLLHWRRKLCDWRDLDALSLQTRRSVTRHEGAVEPFAFLSESASPDEQLACARTRAAMVARQLQPMAPATTIADTTLRLGMLSNGFGAHPTGALIVAFIESLAAMPGVVVHLFATRADDGSAIRQRLARTAVLHEVAGQAHDAVAQRIRQSNIDVLYDLRGWGGGGTPEVLARRPAPVQVNWLAYPGTSGAPWIDYVLADRFVLPPSLANYFSEQVAWLPRCFQPSDIQREVRPPLAREHYGLPHEGAILACFNNSYKINPASFQRMMRVLAGTPGSTLWLLSGPGLSDRRLRQAAQAQGVDPQRLVFTRKLPHDQYLSLYGHADLFLDTDPYNAHTTASDALWAGCPVLTRPGSTFASRVAGSLNHHLGLTEMNVDSDDAFVRKAIALIRDPMELSRVRTALAHARGQRGLFDMVGFARDFLGAARRMAERAHQGLPPQAFG